MGHAGLMTVEQEERRKRSLRRWGTADIVAKRVLELVRNFIVIAVMMAAADASGSKIAFTLATVAAIAWAVFLVAPFFIWLHSAETGRTGWPRWLAVGAAVLAGIVALYFVDDMAQSTTDLIRTMAG
jgi:hypothetical protein